MHRPNRPHLTPEPTTQFKHPKASRVPQGLENEPQGRVAFRREPSAGTDLYREDRLRLRLRLRTAARLPLAAVFMTVSCNIVVAETSDHPDAPRRHSRGARHPVSHLGPVRVAEPRMDGPRRWKGERRRVVSPAAQRHNGAPPLTGRACQKQRMPLTSPRTRAPRAAASRATRVTSRDGTTRHVRWRWRRRAAAVGAAVDEIGDGGRQRSTISTVAVGDGRRYRRRRSAEVDEINGGGGGGGSPLVLFPRRARPRGSGAAPAPPHACAAPRDAHQLSDEVPPHITRVACRACRVAWCGIASRWRPGEPWRVAAPLVAHVMSCHGVSRGARHGASRRLSWRASHRVTARRGGTSTSRGG